jgi:hypothetical protein
VPNTPAPDGLDDKMLAVEKADRRLAADIMALAASRAIPTAKIVQSDTIGGLNDRYHLVQILARHRTAARLRDDGSHLPDYDDEISPEQMDAIRKLAARRDDGGVRELCEQACSNAEQALDYLAKAGRPQLAASLREYTRNIRASLSALPEVAALAAHKLDEPDLEERIRKALADFWANDCPQMKMWFPYNQHEKLVQRLVKAVTGVNKGLKPMTDEQIKHMVGRFLSWRLPENFSPDAGISFKPDFNENTPWPMKHQPVGTNLLNYTQAEAMVRHMLEGMAASLSALPEAQGGETIEALLPEEPSEAIIRAVDKAAHEHWPNARKMAVGMYAVIRKAALRSPDAAPGKGEG